MRLRGRCVAVCVSYVCVCVYVHVLQHTVSPFSVGSATTRVAQCGTKLQQTLIQVSNAPR